ncbi:hypothetical protein U1Q18_000473 [Sarracenia purpurea var. burkii]
MFLLHSQARIQSQAGNNPISPFFLHPLRNRRTFTLLSQTLNPALEMVSERRPMCASCSKPSGFCLCARFKTPRLHNSVGVTILRHSLEQKHPLNSTRIATLGLNNLKVIPVSDVHFEARFVLRPLELDSERVSDGSEVRRKVSNHERTQNVDGSSSSSSSRSGSTEPDLKQIGLGIHPTGEVPRAAEEAPIAFTIRKSGSHCLHHKMPQNQSQNPNFDMLLASPAVHNSLSQGFVVNKWQKKKLNGRTQSEESEEFEIMVPQGSALLFPSDKSVGPESIDFEVKNLIVLDGTWAKARRVYNENPWLKLLPHMKLDLGKMSLYSEVRHQPRAGFLSTIESIVYGLKAVGDETDGLEDLLDVFQSMVEDQRRCKDERLSQISPA